MPPPKKIPKELRHQLNTVASSRNRARAAYGLKGKRTLGAMLQEIGYNAKDLLYVYTPEQLQATLTFKELNDYFDGLECRVRLEYNNKNGEPKVEQPGVEYEYNGITTSGTEPRQDSSVSSTSIIRPASDGNEGRTESVYNPKPPKQKATLHPKQELAAREIFNDYFYNDKPGLCLLAGTGTGKTYVMGSVLRNLVDNGFAKMHGCISPWPYVVVTKSSVVIQTERVFKEEFGLDTIREVHVINIEQLRSQFGQIFIEDKVEVDQGEARNVLRWRNYTTPLVIFWDECQILKNEGSTQSQIAQDYNRVRDRYKIKTYQLFSSATPFARVAEARCFAVATRKKHSYGVVNDIELVDEHWADYAKQIASPADPYEYSPSAMDRLRDHFDSYIHQMKNVRPKFHAHNSVQVIEFKTRAEKEYYDKAWDRFLEEKAKIEGNEALGAGEIRMMILVQFLKFRQAAELCRAPRIAEFLHESWENGQAGTAAVCFKETINKIVHVLVEDYKWTRKDISIVWGGNVNTMTRKKRAAKKMYDMGIDDILKQAGISMNEVGMNFKEDELQGKSEEELAFEKRYDLGPQTPEKRQREIDRFQRQSSKCCLFTFKSGGVGLSLHHAHESARPRCCILTPTYSAMELIQGLGRCPRLTSLSDTSQTMVFYRDTIEEHVAAKVAQKMKCLSKLVRQPESWESIATGSEHPTQHTDLKLEHQAEDIDDALGGVYIEEEDGDESKEA